MNNYYAKYTISLQELLEVNEVELFNFTYDLPNKEELEKRFIENYYFREIAYETYSMWHFKFKARWLIMVKHYKVLFESYKEIDPLLSFEEVRSYIENEKYKGNEETGTIATGKGEGENKDVQRDTPITAYEDTNYVSFVGDGTSKSSSESKSDLTSERDSTKDLTVEETKKIMNESKLKLLNDFVKKYIDIEQRFIDEFRDLFMMLY